MQAVLIAGTVVSALGSIASGYAAKAQYESQAQASQHAATIAEQNAATIALQAGEREHQQRREARQAFGATEAAIAESGSGFGGSNALLYKQSMIDAEVDALNIRYEGMLARTSALNEAQGLRYQAKTAKAAGRNAVIGGWIGAATTGLTGAANYGKQYGFGGRR